MRYHFIAIGGAAMHNLAIALKKNGNQVSGSDDEIFEPSKSRLLRYGMLPLQSGWFPDKIVPELDGVILGMHAREDNPELKKAINLGIPVYSYPQFLFEQYRHKKRVVIAGSHGKTTITAMILHALHYWGEKPDYMVGAQLEGFEVMVQITPGGGVAILEGDEYLTSPLDRRPKFLHYQPHVVLISGIAWDHMNVFPTFENYVEQFASLIHAISPGGTLIYCETDPILDELVRKEVPPGVKCVPYRLPAYSIENGLALIQFANTSYPLQVFGKHNLMNLVGASHVCDELALSPAKVFQAMSTFSGAARRLEKLFDNESVKLFRDFAHAPSKLKATVEAVKEQFPDHRLIACMELHTFSSLNADFLPQYKGSMAGADDALIFFHPDTVMKKKLPPIGPQDIRQAFGRDDLLIYQDAGQLQAALLGLDLVGPKIILLMSSGDFHGLDIEKLIGKCETME